MKLCPIGMLVSYILYTYIRTDIRFYVDMLAENANHLFRYSAVYNYWTDEENCLDQFIAKDKSRNTLVLSIDIVFACLGVSQKWSIWTIFSRKFSL